MFKSNLAILAIFSLFTLVNCGGSGGSDSPPNSGSSSSSSSGGSSSGGGTDIHAVYEGSLEQAYVTMENAKLFVFSYLHGAKMFGGLASAHAPFLADHFPVFLHAFQLYGSNGESYCSTGSFEFNDRRPEGSTTGDADFIFESCKIGEDIYDGTIAVEVVRLEEEFVVTLDDFNISTAIDTISYSGVIDAVYTGDGLHSDELIFTSSSLNTSVKLTDFSMTGRGIYGKVFVEDYGYLTIDQSSETGKVTLIGREDSTVFLDYDFSYFQASLNEEFQLTLNENAETREVATTGTLSELLQWPYQTNLSPDLQLSNPRNVLRHELLDLHTHDTIDANRDFVRFDWQIVDAPECEYVFTQNSNREASLVSDCQGAFTLSIRADDGITEPVVQEFDIDVNPLRAEFVAIQPVSLNVNEALYIPFTFTNSEEDGPFELSVLYGPPGIQIENNVLTGAPQSVIHSGSASFVIGIQADNGQQAVTEIEVTQKQENGKHEIYSSMSVCADKDIGWMPIGDDNRLYGVCSFWNSYKIISLNDAVIEHVYTEVMPPQYLDVIDAGLSYFDADDTPDIVLVYADVIYILDWETREISHSFANTLASGITRIYPSPRQHNGLILSIESGEDEGVYYYDAASDQMLAANNPLLRYINEVNMQDPALSPDGETDYFALLEAQDPDEGFTDHFVDIDGDGDMDAVSLVNPTEGSPEILVSSKDLVTGDITTYPGIVFNAKPNTSYTSALVNLDDDPEKELVVNETLYMRELFVYDFSGDVFELVNSDLTPTECGYLRGRGLVQHDAGTAIIQTGWWDYGWCTFSMDAGFSALALGAPIFNASEYSYGIYAYYFNEANQIEILTEDSRPGAHGVLTRVKLDENLDLVESEKLDVFAPSYGQVLPLTDDPLLPASTIVMADASYNFRIFNTMDYFLGDIDPGFLSWSVDTTQVFYEDINMDGYKDLVATDGTRLLVQDLENLSESEIVFEQALPASYKALVQNFSDDSMVEIVQQYNDSGNRVLSRSAITMGDEGIALEWINSTELVDPSGYYYGPYLSYQDVTNDGLPEIIAHYWGSKFNSGVGDDSYIHIFGQNLEKLFEFKVEGKVRVIPSIRKGVASSSLLVVAGYVEDGQSAPPEQFREIDPRSGRFISFSKPIMGRMDAGSLHILGDDIHSAPKMIMTQTGLQYFE